MNRLSIFNSVGLASLYFFSSKGDRIRLGRLNIPEAGRAAKDDWEISDGKRTRARARDPAAFVCGLRHAGRVVPGSFFFVVPFVSRGRERETGNVGPRQNNRRASPREHVYDRISKYVIRVRVVRHRLFIFAVLRRIFIAQRNVLINRHLRIPVLRQINCWKARVINAIRTLNDRNEASPRSGNSMIIQIQERSDSVWAPIVRFDCFPDDPFRYRFFYSLLSFYTNCK